MAASYGVTVPATRWAHLSLDELKAHCQKFSVSDEGDVKQLAVRLYQKALKYKDVEKKEQLKQMLKMEDKLPASACPRSREKLEQMLIEERPLSKEEIEDLKKKRAAKEANKKDQAKKAAEDSKKQAALAAVQLPSRPENPMKALRDAYSAMAEATNNKCLTMEHCACLLQEWGLMPEDCALYHIVPPDLGGMDHPDNYCILPKHVPTDYEGENKAILHLLILEDLIDKQRLKTALAAGGHADVAKQRFTPEGLKKLVADWKTQQKGRWDPTKQQKKDTKGAASEPGAAGDAGASTSAAAANGAAPPAGPHANGTPAPAAAPTTDHPAPRTSAPGAKKPRMAAP